jgi:hypothetical protein
MIPRRRIATTEETKMTTVNKILGIALAAAILSAGVFYLLWRNADRDLAACRADALRVAADIAAQRKALTVQIGNLEADRDIWRKRAEGTPATVTVVKRLPADCQACAQAWELDRNYANPGPTPPAGVIRVEVRDVLVTDAATWRIDTARLCPACPPITAPRGGSLPATARPWGMAAGLGVGYGMAGPEVDAGIYPAVIGNDKWEVQIGGRAHANLHPTGDIIGNALLEVRVNRRGKW